jgi:hypothetical protein
LGAPLPSFFLFLSSWVHFLLISLRIIIISYTYNWTDWSHLTFNLCHTLIGLYPWSVMMDPLFQEVFKNKRRKIIGITHPILFLNPPSHSLEISENLNLKSHEDNTLPLFKNQSIKFHVYTTVSSLISRSCTPPIHMEITQGTTAVWVCGPKMDGGSRLSGQSSTCAWWAGYEGPAWNFSWNQCVYISLSALRLEAVRLQ